MKPITYTSAPYPEPRLAWAVCALGVIGGCISVYAEASWHWYVLIVVFVLATVGTVHWRAVIDVEEGVVREEAWLWKRRLTKGRRHSVEGFDAIVFRGLGIDYDEWSVGIRHRSGRKIWLKHCGSAGGQRPPGRAAEQFAWQLSCDTGLGIEEYEPMRSA